MPLPIIAGVARCALNWVDSTHGLRFTNVMHHRLGAGTPAALAGDMIASWTNNMWALQSSSILIETVTVIDLTTALGASVDVSTAVADHRAGTGSVDYSPQNATIAKLQTGLRGRSHRGRLYLPAVGETQQTAGTIQGVDAALVQTAWNTYRTTMNALGKPLVVASYALATADDVTNVVIETKTGTQRRRQSQQR